MELLQKDFEIYAFLEEPSETPEAKLIGAEGGDNDTIYTHINTLLELDLIDMKAIVDRTYEIPKWYYIVFAPFNEAYRKDTSWYASKGLDKCRQKFNHPSAYILSRETQATKIHINALVATTENLNRYHEKNYTSKYKMHVQELKSLADRLKVFEYMMKERHVREFHKYMDYLFFSTRDT